MTKKRIGIIVLLIVIAAVSVFFLVAPKSIGNMSNRYTEKTTATSDISFSGKSGDQFRFLFHSTVESGDLDIALYDSSGKKVYVGAFDFDRAKDLKTYFTLDHSDTYTLAAQCSDFIGGYEIRLLEA